MKQKQPFSHGHTESVNPEEPVTYIRCPVCCEGEMTLKIEGKVLACRSCNENYPVINGIPHLIAAHSELTGLQPEIHRIQGSAFNYIDHYRKDAIGFDYFQARSGGIAHGERRVREYTASEVRGKRGIILDVGCGSAWVAGRFCNAGFKVVSMDISALNVSKALEINPANNHTGIVGDANRLPFANGSFDYVIATEVIEHIADPKRFIESLFRVTKPGGCLLVTTPFREKIAYTLCVHCNRMTPLHAHLHSFDTKILASLYNESDLASFKTYEFGNKVLVHLRTHVVLKFFGFRLWRLIDRILNLIYFSPGNMLGIWQKKSNET